MASGVGRQKRGLEDIQEIEVESLERVFVFKVVAVVDGLDVVEEDDEAAVEAFSGHLRNASARLLHAEHVVVIVVVVLTKQIDYFRSRNG